MSQTDRLTTSSHVPPGRGRLDFESKWNLVSFMSRSQCDLPLAFTSLSRLVYFHNYPRISDQVLSDWAGTTLNGKCLYGRAGHHTQVPRYSTCCERGLEFGDRTGETDLQWLEGRGCQERSVAEKERMAQGTA